MSLFQRKELHTAEFEQLHRRLLELEARITAHDGQIEQAKQRFMSLQGKVYAKMYGEEEEEPEPKRKAKDSNSFFNPFGV